MEIQSESLDKQEKYKPLRDEKGRLLPGHSGNLNGRPKGQTLKEYQAEKFRQMTDNEKEEWLKDVVKDTRWRMSEGNPTNEITGGLDIKVSKLEEIQDATKTILNG